MGAEPGHSYANCGPRKEQRTVSGEVILRFEPVLEQLGYQPV